MQITFVRNIHSDWKCHEGTTACILLKIDVTVKQQVKVHVSRVVRLWMEMNVI